MLWGFVDSFMQQQVACMQEKVWARRAFHLRFGHCERVHADHFREGFIAGYCNVCSGSGTETPALPPERYWGFQYRNQEGAEMQTAWFAGYDQGTQSANTDGSGSFKNIQISRQLEQAMMAAEQIEDVYGGIQREHIDGMPPVRVGSGLQPPSSNRPMLDISSMNGQIPIISGSSANSMMPQSNTPVSQPISVPMQQTGAGSNMPLPMNSAPPMPTVPGYSPN